MLKITLPFPPSVNGLYAGKARRYKSAPYETWLTQANNAINGQDTPTITQRCRVLIELEHPDNRHRDDQNYAKAPIDLLVARGILLGDERRYIKSTTTEWLDVEGYNCYITLTPL